jgi:hypothetical protein
VSRPTSQVPPSGDSGSPRLPHYVRFSDLRAAGIVSNWETLRRYINELGFPEGVLLSANIRVWDLSDVEHWIASRPAERKTASRGAAAA